MTYERRDYGLPVEIRTEGENTRISGYAAVFNETSHDLGGFTERIAPGAFKRVLRSNLNTLGLFNHDMNQLLASTASGTLRLNEDTRGLHYEFDLDASDPDHQRVISKVRRGDLRGSSFAFLTNRKTDEWTTDADDYPQRIVHEVAALRDVGPVTTPAYGQTEHAGAALAFRSLAEQAEVDVNELVDAVSKGSLKEFLLRTQDVTPDSADAAATPDAAADEQRKTLVPPADPPVWYTQYLKE